MEHREWMFANIEIPEIGRQKSINPKRYYRRVERSSGSKDRTVMGFKIEKLPVAPDFTKTDRRPRCWEPLFKALEPGDSFEFPKSRFVGLRSTVSRMNKRFHPKRSFWFMDEKSCKEQGVSCPKAGAVWGGNDVRP